MRNRKQALVDTLLPEVVLDIFSPCLRGELEGGEYEQPGPHRSAKGFVTQSLSLSASPASRGGKQAQGDSPLWLEIGFGGGEHLAYQAALHPDVNIIGCEPYINGIAELLKHLDDQAISNVRIWQQDARLLIEQLPEASIERVFIFYPDPWPKVRHHKRRLISTAFLQSLARIMKPGAELRLATDDEDYGIWMLEHLLLSNDFRWMAKNSVDWTQPPPDWISTRYEQKALAAGRVPTYLHFLRK